MVEIIRCAGSQFDPRVVEILRKRYRELESLVTQDEAKEPTPSMPVQRSHAPAAGLETQASSNDTGFLASIAAARHEAQALFELSHELGNSLSLDETLSMFALRLRRLVPYDTMAVYVCRNEHLTAQFVSGDNFRLFSSLEIPLGQGLSGWVASNGKPIINGNPGVEYGYHAFPGQHTILRSALAVPLSAVNGVVGVLALYRAEPEAFARDHLRILLAISSKVALCVENALRYEQAESSATTDYLTGLPNCRSLFLHLDQELSRCRRMGTSLAVMVCDLNGFKGVNDRFGHLEGNRVLQVFARAVRSACREYDYVARMGGDEFVVVAPGMPPEAAEVKAAQLNEFAKQASVDVCGQNILSVSVGVAFYGTNGRDAEELLAEADRQMYMAKQVYHERQAGAARSVNATLASATVN